MQKDSFNLPDQWLRRWGLVPMLLFAGILYFLALKYAAINSDAGTYLSNVEAMADGAILFRDLQVGYTPVGMYLLYIPRLLFGSNTNYVHYLALILMFNLLNAGWIYLIASQLPLKPVPGWIATLISLFLFLTYEGCYIALEPFCIFFALAAIFFALKGEKHPRFYFWAGIAVGLSFLCKQYGLAVGLPLAYCLWTMQDKRNSKIQSGLLAALGFLFPAILVLTYYTHIHGVNPWQMLTQWFPLSTYGDKDLKLFLLKELRFILISAPLLLLLPFVFANRETGRDRWLWLLFWAAVAFSMPLYIKTFDHYLLLLIPFSTLLSAYILDRAITGRFQQWLAIALIGVWGLGIGFRGYLYVKGFWRYSKARNEQYQLVSKLHRRIPPGSTVLLLSHNQYVNYLGRFQPPDLKRDGFGFPENFDRNHVDELMALGIPVLTDREMRLRFPWHMELLEKNGYSFSVQTGPIEIWNVETPTDTEPKKE